MERRIPTGVYGLDELIGGGFRNNTVNMIYGGTGTGKTTFSMQFLNYGLSRGERGIFISMEMTPEQILRECRQMGWKEVERWVEEERLRIIHTHGEDIVILSRFIQELEEEMEEGRLRIAIDPITPLIYNFHQRRHRKTISEFFNGLRRLGTSVVTLEEMEGVETMPLYLADSVIKLQSLGYGERYDRTLRIIKFRGGKHGEGLYPFTIERGLGIVIDVSEDQINKVSPKMTYKEYFELAKKRIMEFDDEIKNVLLNKIEALESSWTRDESPEKVLQMMFRAELGREF